ncbi:MAG: hypothetical protein NVSMB30_00460 [Hymenobacter sp.]
MYFWAAAGWASPAASTTKAKRAASPGAAGTNRRNSEKRGNTVIENKQTKLALRGGQARPPWLHYAKRS